MASEAVRIFLPQWVQAFLLTLAFEVPVVLYLTRGDASVARRALGAVLGTCVTHPLLWFLWPVLFTDYVTYIASGEILTALIEAAVLRLVVPDLGWSRCVVVALLANALSFVVGLILMPPV